MEWRQLPHIIPIYLVHDFFWSCCVMQHVVMEIEMLLIPIKPSEDE
jgi:hypothetical protein